MKNNKCNFLSLFTRIFSVKVKMAQASASGSQAVKNVVKFRWHEDKQPDSPKRSTKGLKRIPLCMTVSLEGNCGIGKTELLDMFKTVPGFQIHEEPIAKWRKVTGSDGQPINLIRNFYEDTEKFASLFQSYVRLTFHQIMKKRPRSNTQVRIFDRCPFSAKCFIDVLKQGSKMTAIEHHIATEWLRIDAFDPLLVPDLILYIRGDPRICYERIMKDSDPNRFEEDLNITLLEQLHEEHEKWLIDPELRMIPVGSRGSFKSATDFPRHNTAVIVLNGHQATSKLAEEAHDAIWSHFERYQAAPDSPSPDEQLPWTVSDPPMPYIDQTDYCFTSPAYFETWLQIREGLLAQATSLKPRDVSKRWRDYPDEFERDGFDPYDYCVSPRAQQLARMINRRRAFMTAFETREYDQEEAKHFCSTPCPRFLGYPKCICEVYHLPAFEQRVQTYDHIISTHPDDEHLVAHLKDVRDDQEQHPEDDSSREGANQGDDEGNDQGMDPL
jgi:deoxyadenosine/deoxycytidine kinase